MQTTQQASDVMSVIDLADPTIDVVAGFLADVETLRIAMNHRMNTMVSSEPDDDGIIRGHGIPVDHPNIVGLRDVIVGLQRMEVQLTRQLERIVKAHPMGPWIASQKGIGFKQAGRLLSVIGDPYLNSSTGERRRVSQLWGYCGLGVLQVPSKDNPDILVGEAPRLKRGQRANWSTNAKTRAYLVATSCIKQTGTTYREVYDRRRAHTAITHPDWTDGHSHNDALRVLSKYILKQMWIEARRLHGFTGEENAEFPPLPYQLVNSDG